MPHRLRLCMWYMNLMAESRSALSNRKDADPDRWLDDYGDYLYGYAYFRIRSRHVAEDLVQETLLSAIKGLERFEGRSTVKTWLTSILRNKIVDYVRKSKREVVVEEVFPIAEAEGEFDESGAVNPMMGARQWAVRPDEAMSRTEFWQALQHCIGGLPNDAADVFMGKEIDGLSTDEICDLKGMTKSNVWVILHRTRKALRKCLEEGWFKRQMG